jgi:pinin/SDK/memA protein
VILYRQVQVSGNDQALDTDATMQDAQTAQATAAAAAAPKKRPRLDLTIEPRERKRGKSMFGLLVGTLNKAKTEDEARNASEAVRGSICIRNCTTSDLVSGQETAVD